MGTKHLVICRACDGEGHVPDLNKPKGDWYESKVCPYCGGKGWVVSPPLAPV